MQKEKRKMVVTETESSHCHKPIAEAIQSHILEAILNQSWRGQLWLNCGLCPRTSKKQEIEQKVETLDLKSKRKGKRKCWERGRESKDKSESKIIKKKLELLN